MVCVTGMGMVTALGCDVYETWEKLCNGENAIKEITEFDTSELDTKIAAVVPFDKVENKVRTVFSKRECKQMTKNTKMGLVCANEAIKQSGILENENIDKSRVAVIMGVVTTNSNDIYDKKPDSHFIVKTMPNSISAWLTIKYGFEGANFNVSSACASSAYAIILGESLIKSDLIDVAIVGGSDASVEPKYIKGFNQILAMSSKNDSNSSCCPFSKDRDGFVMGEGAGALVLESESHAKKRNAKVYAKLLGSAFTSEASDVVAPKKDGEGMQKTMEYALKNANITYKDIDYINAHGTSTYLNDKYETMAIKKCFKERQKEISISSTKSMLGHTVAACGAVESIVTIMSLINGKITPTINYNNPDEELDLDYTPNVCRKRDIDVAMTNSFGFGGHNASIIYKKV